MQRILQCVLALILSLSLKSQSPVLTYTNVTGSNSITCSAPSLNFIASVSNYTNGPLTYSWASANATATGSNVTLSSSGQYTLTAFNQNISFSLTQVFTIGTNTTSPTSLLSPTFQTITCFQNAAQTISATANPTTNITHQFYSPGGGVVTVHSFTSIYSPGGPGTFTYCLINNVNGCSTCKTFTVASNNNYPTLNLSGPALNFTLGCGSFSNTTINLQGNATPNANAPVSYTLLPPYPYINNYGVGSSLVYTITIPGLYTAVIRDNTTSCERRIPFTIWQDVVPPAFSYNVATQTLSCNTPSVIIYAVSTGTNVTYQWSSAGGNATGNNYTVNATANITSPAAGNYTLTAINSSNACSSSSVITMYQNRFPPHASIAGPIFQSITCATPSIILSSYASTSIPPIAFPSPLGVVVALWQGPIPQSTLSNSPTYTAVTPGVYTLTAKDLNNGCTSNTTTVVNDGRIYPLVSPSPLFYISCSDQTISISPVVSGPTTNNTYSWTAPANASVSGINSLSLTTNAAGIYTVEVANYSCITVANVTVSTCMGINANPAANTITRLFPNPNNGLFTVSTNNLSESMHIDIYNALGVLIKTQAISSEETLIDLKSEVNGIYLMYLTDKNKTVSVSKIVKQ